jgi:threonine dehydratase
MGGAAADDGPVIAIDDVKAAAARIDGIAHRTPVLTSRTLDEQTGARVFLKAENLQRAGAFKFRGACNAVASLGEDERARGVATVSSGNHAQALALAARLHGVTATILMPDDAPAGKLAATRGYGAEVIGFDRYGEDREELLAALVAERGLVPIHPYDDPRVMAGQGTLALELLEQAGPLDLLLVCVGGGGLIAGCSTAAAAVSPETRVIGIEPEAGDDTRRSLAAGERVRIPVPRTIADGQQLPIPGELTFEVTRRLVAGIEVASDAEIVAAMRFLFERLKTVAEPSGACALAALLAGRVRATGLRVGVTLTGGNVSAERFAQLMAGERWPGGPGSLAGVRPEGETRGRGLGTT